MYALKKKNNQVYYDRFKEKNQIRKKKPEEPILWVVRYDNGDIGCLYGSQQEVEEYAAREAEKKGTGYRIV